jgi:hypothetical protein
MTFSDARVTIDMPVTYEWLIPDQVIGLRWWGDVDQQELAILDAGVLDMLNTTQNNPIHFVSYELDLITEPSLKAYIQTRSPRHAHFGWYIIIQPRHKAFARMLAQMACTILGLRFRIVPDEGMAWKYIEQINPQLKQPSASNVTP